MALDTANLCILTGNANPDLAKKIADHIGVNLCDVYVGHFNNGETQVMISESIRGKDIFIIQPTSYPVNDNLMELLIMADACKRASAHSITAVVPYYAYARQDRKTRGREPISAKLVANLMTTAGVTRVVTVDLHAGQIQGFFDIPVDNMLGSSVLIPYIAGKFGVGTQRAVQEFQLKNKMNMDGKVGQNTWNVLYTRYTAKHGLNVPYPGIVLHTGSSGGTVRLVQQKLNSLGERLKDDGKYGAATAAAVQRFQRRNGLTADGSVGYATWEKMF